MILFVKFFLKESTSLENVLFVTLRVETTSNNYQKPIPMITYKEKGQENRSNRSDWVTKKRKKENAAE